MTFADIMKDISKGRKLVARAEQVWDAVTGDFADTHALGQALIELGQALQGDDVEPLQ